MCDGGGHTADGSDLDFSVDSVPANVAPANVSPHCCNAPQPLVVRLSANLGCAATSKAACNPYAGGYMLNATHDGYPPVVQLCSVGSAKMGQDIVHVLRYWAIVNVQYFLM